jgi:hypothetical protein
MAERQGRPERRGRCSGCRKLRVLRDDGKVAQHSITIPVSRTAIHDVGAGSVSRPCSGAGKPPLEDDAR